MELQEWHILPPPLGEAIEDVVAESHMICFLWNSVLCMPKWIWSSGRHANAFTT
jgi:hypothetical protein